MSPLGSNPIVCKCLQYSDELTTVGMKCKNTGIGFDIGNYICAFANSICNDKIGVFS